MESTILTLRESLPALKSTLKLSTTKLQTLKSAPTTSELAAMVENLRRDNAEKIEKLGAFQSGSVKMVTTEEMEKVEKEFKYWGKKRVIRRNAYLSLEGNLLEGMTKDEIWEKVGIEEDTYWV
jgi:26S proteasome regulatory subunit, ATPase 3, interacting protein